ncbi:MAG: MarR family transcriptional regulator, partial [Candidatus Dormibacteraeota bacterium]|nr:MarR family transcriptional regulator [Candidatus Dormibacteraeota bacterium]
PAATAIVASLEAEGLARREPDPTDRRVARVAITARGRERLDRARSRRTAFVAGRLAGPGGPDLEEVARVVALLESLVPEPETG